MTCKLALALLASALALHAFAQPRIPPPGAGHPAHQAPDLAWADEGGDAALRDKVAAGWVLRPGRNGCMATTPIGETFDFAPRSDGKCYVQDAHAP